MDDRRNEVASDELPDFEPGGALSIEKTGRTNPGVTLDSSGSLTGSTIGHYLVGERLGGGAMSAVYRAHDQEADRSVAIKVLLPGADAVMRERFRREADMVSKLVHPHIVRTLDVQPSGEMVYIVMELVEGISLGDLLERFGKLAVSDSARILACVAEALAYAHKQGIVHRDVKPSNILLRRANPGAPNSVAVAQLPYPVVPLLSDFGIARALDAPELTNAGRTIGTPAFMAPEQCAGSAEIDGRADIYSLGAVLYRCLVGRPPFMGTTTQILHAHVYDDLMIPGPVAAALPLPMRRVMERALKKEPAERFARVDAMTTQLRAIGEMPDQPAEASAGEIVDPTMTMESLPVAPSPNPTASNTTTWQVLVAGPKSVVEPKTVPVRQSPIKPAPRQHTLGTTASRPVAVAPISPPMPARVRPRRNRWGMIAIGGSLIVLVLLLVAVLINNMLPEDSNNNISENSTATPVAIAQAGTPQAPVVATSNPAVNEGKATPIISASETVQSQRPTPTATIVGTPTPIPTPAVPLDAAWAYAKGAYDDSDWDTAASWLYIARRILSGTNPPRIEGVTASLVDQMLMISYVGAATDLVTQGKFEAAIDFLDKAVELAPTNRIFPNMVETLTGLVEIKSKTDPVAAAKRKELVEQFAAQLASYADILEATEDVCEAATQVNNARKIADTEQLQDRTNELGASCDKRQATDAIVELGGSILYSAESGGSYSIWRLPVSRNNLRSQNSTMILGNAAQPQLSPDGSLMAYHNRPGNDGLYVVPIGADWKPAGSATRIGVNAEDGRDGPASWDRSGSRLVYGAGFSPPKVYVASIGDPVAATALNDGKDPAWNPASDLIVFSGPNINANDWALRKMTSSQSGNDRFLVGDTINGNDIRPTWSSDGRYVVFMSKDRGNPSASWEVYRLEINTGEVIPLTDGDPAQDGLPSVSPDNQWVAFLSDRNNTWQLFYVSIDGGAVHYMSDLAGQPISWLEHAIQWVP